MHFLLRRLEQAGHSSYVVGGAVRNAFMGRASTDWDVATSASPEEIQSLFHDLRHFMPGHGTVTFLHNAYVCDVTSFRGASNSIQADLASRDFTINALAYNPGNHAILDPYSGRSHIDRKLIKAVLSPESRFREDPLRLLRAARLSAEFAFRIEAGTLEAIKEQSSLLRTVAVERIRDELFRLLMSPKPSTGLRILAGTGLLRHFLPELMEGYRKRQNSKHRHTIFVHIMETVDRVKPLKHLRMAALLHDVSKPRVLERKGKEWRFHGHERKGEELSLEIMKRLRLSNAFSRRVAHLVRHHMIDYQSQWSDAAVRRLIRRVGREALWDLLELRRADLLAHGTDTAEDLKLLAQLEARIQHELGRSAPVHIRDLAIDGREVMATLDIAQGPRVGRVLRDLMEAVTADPGLNEKNALFRLLLTKHKPQQDLQKRGPDRRDGST